MRLLFALILGTSAGAATLGQQTITLPATPAALSCSGQRYVNKLTIRVIPGFGGKVFVGASGMDAPSYANTLAILFPNLGAHSEEYVVQDPSGDDGIDLCSIYVAGEISGENAIAEYVSNNGGATAPKYLLVPSFAGVSLSSAGLDFNNASVARAQVIPGEALPKIMSIDANPYYESGNFVLSPNNGIPAQHNGWSEVFEMFDPLGNNGINGNLLNQNGFQDDPSQGILASLWTKQTSSGALQQATVRWIPIATSLLLAGPISLPLSDGSIYEPRFSYVDGTSISTISVGDCGAANGGLGNVARVLYPTSSSLYSKDPSTAFHESLAFGSSAFDSAGICFRNNLGDSESFVSMTGLLLDPASAAPPPVALSTVSEHAGGMIAPAAGGTAINRGNVKHLVVSVTVGEGGMMFIGSAGMNTSTLDGVYAILYPNYGDENGIGRWSETLELDDPEGDGIQTNGIYIQSEIPGEEVMVSTTTSGVAPADGVLSVKASGALLGTFGSYAAPFAANSTPFSFLRAQAIPGGYGKLLIGTSNMTAAQPDNSYANLLKVLWPSEGNYNIGEGHSERFTQACHAGPVSAPNCLDLQSFTFWPDYPWEQLLVFALGR
jgi:hypothetical protein